MKYKGIRIIRTKIYKYQVDYFMLKHTEKNNINKVRSSYIISLVCQILICGTLGLNWIKFWMKVHKYKHVLPGDINIPQDSYVSPCSCVQGLNNNKRKCLFKCNQRMYLKITVVIWDILMVSILKINYTHTTLTTLPIRINWNDR